MWILEFPWWSSGYDSNFPSSGAWVQSLVGELKSCMPHSMGKIKSKESEGIYFQIKKNTSGTYVMYTNARILLLCFF